MCSPIFLSNLIQFCRCCQLHQSWPIHHHHHQHHHHEHTGDAYASPECQIMPSIYISPLICEFCLPGSSLYHDRDTIHKYIQDYGAKKINKIETDERAPEIPRSIRRFELYSFMAFCGTAHPKLH